MGSAPLLHRGSSPKETMLIKSKTKEISQRSGITYQDDKYVITRHERIPDGLLKANQIARETKGLKYVDEEKEWHWVARIPKVVYDQLLFDYPDEMKSSESKFLYEWLDRPENQIWKTFKGNIL